MSMLSRIRALLGRRAERELMTNYSVVSSSRCRSISPRACRAPRLYSLPAGQLAASRWWRRSAAKRAGAPG